MKLPAFIKTYDGVAVLDFPGMEIEPGKIYAVIGANGSGKSTFAKILSGVLPADRKVQLPQSVGYLPQKPYAFRMSTKKNILLGGSEEAKANELMWALQISHLEKKRADRLSGGETARMAIARLMMKAFDLVILDEPTAAMDIETTAAAESLILDYTGATGCATILVTHSLQQARRVADEALFFYKGKLMESGAKERLLYHPTQPETKRFLEFYGQ
ncbi:MAG: ATP-binding cassette domain-containing protein [Oscillospiraceae bacterium]|nr:ATP-binding cassette domain-containing protein [Oscillospiraceae bacterium]